MLLCDRGDNTVKVLPPDGTVILQSFIASNCDKSPSSALGHNDMFFVSMANYVKVFNNEGEFLYDTGTGLAVDKFDSLLVGDDKNAQVFYTGKKICKLDKKTGPSTSKPTGCCCIKRWASIHY